jgi:integrase
MDLQEGNRPPQRPGCKTVSELIALYLPQAKRENAPATYVGKVDHLGRFDKAYGHMAIADLRPIDLQNFLNAQVLVKSEWTIRGIIATVKRVFNWALEMEEIDRHPFAKYRSRGKLVSRRRPTNDNDFQTMLRFSPPVYRRFLIFLKLTGCRPGEASSMRWSDIRFEQRCVVLQEHKTAGKTGKPRLIPLVPTLLKMLVWMRRRRQTSVVGLLERLLRAGPVKGVEVARFFSHYGVSDRAVFKARETLGVIRERVPGQKGYYTYRLPDDHAPTQIVLPDQQRVFVSCLGNPLNKSSLSLWMRRLRKRSGVAELPSLYSLRHRFGFQGIKQKVNLKLLSLAMGHTNTKMTEHYIDESGLSDEVIQAALQVAHGPGAYLVEPPPPPFPVGNISPPPVGQIPVTTEHVPKRFGNPRPRSHVMADVADVQLPAVNLSDPGEQSVAQLMRQMMAQLSVQKKRVLRHPTTNANLLNPTHEQSYLAAIWAVEQNPALAEAKDGVIFAWLKTRPDCPFKLPPMFGTFQRYVSAARCFHGTRKRILPSSRPSQPPTKKAGAG